MWPAVPTPMERGRLPASRALAGHAGHRSLASGWRPLGPHDDARRLPLLRDLRCLWPFPHRMTLSMVMFSGDTVTSMELRSWRPFASMPRFDTLKCAGFRSGGN